MTSLDKNLNAANRRFSFKSAAFAEDKFSVVRVDGSEAISKDFHFELILVSDDGEVDFANMLANPATFTLYAVGSTDGHTYHGVLSEFEQLHQAGALVFYRAVLSSKLHKMTLYRTSDVFLNDQTIPDVLDAVFKSNQLTSADYRKDFKGSYRKRGFVCQYQETNFDFVSRWLQKEGIYYYFDQSGSSEKLVLLDDKDKQPQEAAKVVYRTVEDVTGINSADAVLSFVCRQKPLPKQVVLQDFSYQSAAVQLKYEALVSNDGVGDVMLYGENCLDEGEVERYAKIRAQEILCGGKVFKGEATAVGLRSGYLMEMSGHYRSNFNGKYLVTGIEHKGSQAGVLLAGINHPFKDKEDNKGETHYSNVFWAIPADVQFRPKRSLIRPHIAGSMSAIVDSEGSGDYAEMDDLGQYKVQLPFSKTGKSANQGSARIRMATPYSGRDHGMHFPLLKGAEVLLSFVDGDPDQPVIVNTVPNSENPSLVSNKNPTKDIIKSAGGGFMEFEDTKGRQHLQLYSPTLKSSLRMGAATNAQSIYSVATLEPWKPNYGMLCETQGNMGLNPVGALVLKAGSESKFPTDAPNPGELQMLTKSTLMDLDNTRPSSQPTTTPGVLEVYAKRINMYAEPTGGGQGVSAFQYQLITSSGPAPAPAAAVSNAGAASSPAPAPAPAPAAPANGWSMADLYTLGNLGNLNASLEVLPADGVREIVGVNKTSYTQANSNSATFGNSATVTRGNSIKLTRGMDTSHTWGMSNSLYFGMKSDMMMGLSNSTYLGVKNDLYIGGKMSFALSAELKVAVSATADATFGTKNTLNAAAEINAKLLEAKAVATEQMSSIVNLRQDITSITQSLTSLGNAISNIESAALHIVT